MEIRVPADVRHFIRAAERASIDHGRTLECFQGHHAQCTGGWLVYFSVNGETTRSDTRCECPCHLATVLPPQMEAE